MECFVFVTRRGCLCGLAAHTNLSQPFMHISYSSTGTCSRAPIEHCHWLAMRRDDVTVVPACSLAIAVRLADKNRLTDSCSDVFPDFCHPSNMTRRSTMMTIGILLIFFTTTIDGFALPISHRRSAVGKLYSEETASAPSETEEVKPDILLPFPPAADPMYKVRGPLGERMFVVSREGDPTDEELSNENILRIVKIESSDLEVRYA